MMSPKCIQTVTAMAGRALSPAKLQAIDDAIGGKMRELARRDAPRWRGLSADQRMTEAATAAMQDLQAQAALKEYRASLQVIKAADTDGRIAALQALGNERSGSLSRDIAQTGVYVDAVRNEAVSGLGDLMDAAGSRDGTGLLRNLGMRIFDLDNPQMTADVVREVFRGADGHTGNKAAQAGAKAWLDTIEALRLRFNAAGGDVGKLGYGYLSQAHDAVRVLQAGADAWATKVLPLLDRNQYLREDGSLMPDAELRNMLTAAHETITTGGDNKVAPGAFRGSGSRANKGSESRVIHFKDGDAWMQYMQDFGEGSLYDSMMGHIGAMARSIGLVEKYGPNPESTFRVQQDIAQRADGVGTLASRDALNQPEAYWNIVSGKTGMPENRFLAARVSDLRNLQTAAKLGGAILSSFTDTGTIGASLHYNRLPYFEFLSNLKGQIAGDAREQLQVHGVIAESAVSTLNRFTGDHMTNSLSGRVAGAVMKLSLLNAWTDGLRGAFAQTMMGGLAKMASKDWASLTEWDRHLLMQKGISEADWSIISQAQPTMINGRPHLTPDSIRATGLDGAQEAATKALAFVVDESQFAVVNPDMATRAIVTGGGMPAGTINGEAMRAFAQFKSFPIAMMTRHWRRILETPQGLEGAPAGYGAESAGGAVGNRLALFAGLNVTLMMLGAVVLQTKAVQNGKDPYDMTEGKFWSRALTQGGGLGYLGDFVFKDPTEQRGNSFEQAAGAAFGPSAGAVAGVVGDLGIVNAWEAAKGKETNAGAEALRLANSNLPGASLWYVRPAWEHWFLHNAQEALNPGYLSRMQQRAQKDWGQGYYWRPGETLPDRAPDFGGAFGE
jgi:hypothetical protein